MNKLECAVTGFFIGSSLNSPVIHGWLEAYIEKTKFQLNEAEKESRRVVDIMGDTIGYLNEDVFL